MKTYSHNYGKYELEKSTARLFSNVQNSLDSLQDYEGSGIKDEVEAIFDSWDKRGKNTEAMNLRYGYRRGQVQSETQFGNVARYYTDIMKLEKAYKEGEIKYGIYILPTKDRAKDIGSNIANFEKARDELREFRNIIEVPLVLYGI